jgi:carotenoid 1,2-hydratase
VFQLDDPGRHFWRPIAPTARVEIALDNPSMRWSGHGYLDSNWGTEGLEDGFVRWDWSRAELEDGCGILYDAERRVGGGKSLALRFDRQGRVEEMSPPPRVALSSGLWRVKRGTQADTTEGVTIRRTLEDTPFYTREVLDTRLFGERAEAVHESLDCDRFASTWVRLLLPFRMPRIGG